MKFVMTRTLTPEHILLTGAHGTIGKYILRQLLENGFQEAVEFNSEDDFPLTVTTLGLDDRDCIRGDIRHAVPPVPPLTDTVIHCAGANPGAPNSVLEIRGLGNLLEALNKCAGLKSFVFISSTDVYGLFEGEGVDETAPLNPATDFGRMKAEAERILTEWCTGHSVALTILRCPPVVATGMQGPMRRLVNDIYRGSYRHIADNQAKVSVVHGVDVARAAIDMIGRPGVYNLTDGADPTRHALAEALAWRMGNKRIFTIPLSKAKKLARINDFLPFTRFDSEAVKRQTSTLTFSSDKIRNLLSWQPNVVTEYLRTHNYDDNSL